MRGTGGWGMQRKTALMAITIYFLGAAAAFATGAGGGATDSARRASRPAPRTTAECMSQWRSLMADPRPDRHGNGLPPDDMCQNSRRLPADEGRCKKIYVEVINAYTEAETSVKKLCNLVPRAYAAQCDNQGDCLRATTAFQREYSAAIREHNENVRNLINRMDESAKLGMDASEQFAHDLKELKASTDMTISTETARRHGGSTIADALRNHSGQDAETVLRILQRARETSTISQQEIEQSIASPYVFESLQASAAALDQKRDLEEYSKSLSEQGAAVSRMAETGGGRGVSMSSVNGSGESSILPSGLPALQLAAPALGTTGGDVTAPASAYPSTSATAYVDDAEAPSARRTPAARNQLGKGVSGTEVSATGKGVGVDGALVAATDSPSADGTAASSAGPTAGPGRTGPSIRDTLKARLARRAAALGEGVSGEDGARAGNRAGYAIGPDGRPLIGGATLDPDDPNAGRMPPMTMQNSETEDAVKALVNSFENSLGGGRSPASEIDGGNEILARDTPSLFLRLKEVHVRCVKRGCVTQVQGKGKI